MVYSYTPTYYSSIHDTITSLCKNIIPFSSASLNKRRLQSADQKLSKQQSDNLKWQQESFHRILNLIGLRNEGIVQEIEVSTFRIQLLETLITSPPTQENASIVRDKLLFLQELFFAKCISVEEYHSSKRPLLQRLAVQGAEIEATDVIVARPSPLMENNFEKPEQQEEEEKWSFIDFKDDETSLMEKENQNQNKKKRSTNPMKERIRGAASMIGLIVNKKGKKSGQTDQLLGGGAGGFPFPANNNSSSTMNYQFPGGGNGSERYEENPFWEDKENDSSKSILMHENRQLPAKTDQVQKKKPFSVNWFRQREQIKQQEEENRVLMSDSMVKIEKKNSKLGFDVGLHKWDRSNNLEEEVDEEEMDDKCTTPLTKSKY